MFNDTPAPKKSKFKIHHVINTVMNYKCIKIMSVCFAFFCVCVGGGGGGCGGGMGWGASIPNST